MKRLFLVLILTALALPQVGQAGWWKTYGGSGYDVGNCVQIMSDGNYIISGQKNGYLWLLKVDTSGNLLWEKTYGKSDARYTGWLEETSDGGFIISPGSPSLVKVNTQGESLWTKDYSVKSYCVQQTFEGGYILTGGNAGYGYDTLLTIIQTNSQGEILSSWNYGKADRDRNSGFFIQKTNDSCYVITGLTGFESESYASTSLWLLKIDKQGDTVWTREYGKWENQEMDGGFCIKQTTDGGYIISGYRNQYQNGGVWLLKTDSLGDTLWTHTYASESGGEGYYVQETNDGGYIITGTTSAVYLSSSSPGRHLWLIKTDSQGDTLWTRTYEGEDQELGKCLKQLQDQGYIITGYTTSYGSGGNGDLWLLRTDSLGLLAISEQPIPDESYAWEVSPNIGKGAILKYWDSPQGFHARIFDISGREIRKIDEAGPSGILTLGVDYPNGVYFIRPDHNPRNIGRIVIIK